MAKTIHIEQNVRRREFFVDQNFDGWRLDVFLADRIGSISRTFAAQIIEEGDVRINADRPIKKSLELKEGEVITVLEYLEPEDVQDPQASILYHKNGVIAVDKPAGMLSHQVGDTRLNTVNAYLSRQGYDKAKIAHRLDCETSGVVLCGADKDMVGELHSVFRERRIDKIYRALVVDPEAEWKKSKSKTLDTPIGPDEESSLPMKKTVGENKAITHVEFVDHYPRHTPPLSDLKIRIETGRQHQIRAHLALEETPIAGDKLYNHTDRFFEAISDYPNNQKLRKKLIFERQALHAWRVRFNHPETDKPVALEAPIPFPNLS